MMYQFADEANSVVLKIDEDDLARVSFIVDASGQLQDEYRAWLAEGNTPEPYVHPPPPTPQQISDRQFFQQAAIASIITQDEAIAAVATGAIPVVLQAIVDGITDADQKFAATMLLSGATVFERNHPLTEAVGASLGWTSEQIDEFFFAADKL